MSSASPWRVAVLLATIVAVVAFAGWRRWEEAPIHGATPLFTRTTSDGVTIAVERGDVRWHHLFCGTGDGAEGSCTGRSPGVLVRFTLPGGAAGDGIPVDDGGTSDVCASEVLRAGLGIPPGSTEESFTLVRAAPTVALVRQTRPDGTTDEMAPVDGVAVLATRTGWRGDDIEYLDGSGAPVARCSLALNP